MTLHEAFWNYSVVVTVRYPRHINQQVHCSGASPRACRQKVPGSKQHEMAGCSDFLKASSDRAGNGNTTPSNGNANLQNVLPSTLINTFPTQSMVGLAYTATSVGPATTERLGLGAVTVSKRFVPFTSSLQPADLKNRPHITTDRTPATIPEIPRVFAVATWHSLRVTGITTVLMQQVSRKNFSPKTHRTSVRAIWADRNFVSSKGTPNIWHNCQLLQIVSRQLGRISSCVLWSTRIFSQ